MRPLLDSSLRFAIVFSVKHRERTIGPRASLGLVRVDRDRPGRIDRVGSRVRTAGSAVIFAIVLVLQGGGCYSFTGTNLPGHVRTIGVRNVINSTLEPGIELEVTTAVTDEFLDDGRLKIASLSSADARLDAEIIQYENRVNDYSTDQNPLNYVIVFTLKAELIDQVKNQKLWRDDRIVVTEVYDPTQGETEVDARQRIVATLAADIVNRTLEQW